MGGTAPAWGSFLQRLRVLRCCSTAGREEQCPQGVVLPGFGAGGQAACCWWAAAQPGSCCETLWSFFFSFLEQQAAQPRLVTQRSQLRPWLVPQLEVAALLVAARRPPARPLERD